ncbi:M10 family metallopeptidase C-terminal domain-containing protein [Azospirillum sp. TSO35-2]|uniref:M10 family metallopeptidase C-terminal domain-containing protein n=1 Tax=Azospirillum sp. TSO35-2 TaxID=716796 RepID=UPI000D64A488|nr:M10 family metallopeptidase C-terminal domain-containing protein [Azospirillum sp. TSO35-2]
MATGISIADGPTGNSAIDSILYGTKWTSTSLTYSFPTAASDLSDYSLENSLNPTYFDTLNSSQKLVFKEVLEAWSAISGLSFTEAATPSDADLRIYWYRSPDNPTARVVDFPSAAPEGGDLQLGNSVWPGAGSDWSAGAYGYFTLLHELGHALGLKHPHDSINGYPAADAATDSVASSVMSYRSYPGEAISGYTILNGSYPFAPMLNDIAAVQHLYGANWTTNNGETIYTFDPSANVVFTSIWDGGGIDTYNLSNYTTNLSVDLQPGAWTDFGTQHAILDYDIVDGEAVPRITASANLSNPYLYDGDTRSLIENALGGSGNDIMVGNTADNALTGNGGNDSLDGGVGNDTLIGGSGDDTLIGGEGADSLSGGTGFDRLTGGNGNDTLAGGADDDTLLGGGGANLLYGDDGNDSLIGDLGNDTLYGGAGNDTLSAGAGANLLYGDDGNDSLVGGVGDDTLDGGAGNDTLLGGDGVNTLSGGDGTDSLIAGTGNDTLTGGVGDDTLSGGSGSDLFLFNDGGDGTDTITDFGLGDTIRLIGHSFADLLSLGDGTATAAHGVEVGATDGGVTSLYIDTDGIADAAEMVVKLVGSYSAGDLQLSGSDIRFYVPPPPPPSPPPDTSTTTETIGGTSVQTTVTSGGGTTVVAVSISPPTSATPVSVPIGGTSGSGLTAALPMGVGLSATGPQNRVDRGAAVDALTASVTTLSSDPTQRASLTGAITTYGATLPSTATLTVRTVTPSLSGGAATGEPITITGSGAGAEAIVVDARNLPSGTILNVDNVGFLVIVGSVQVGGGAGSQVAIGDSSAQIMVLGADDDTLRGGAGDDIVGSRGGRDLLYGDAGNDTVFGGLGYDRLQGGTGDDLLRGDEGIDAVRVEAGFNDVQITRGVYGSLVMTSATLGTDRMEGVELLRFDDRVELVNAPTGIVTDTGASQISETLYLARNPDVAQAVARGEFTSGMDHYRRYGAAEGRLKPVALDESFYLAQNPDVAQAVTHGDFTSGLQHFLLFGEAEGRDPNALFDAGWYLDHNPDVAAALQAGTVTSAYEHYETFGWKEGRTPSAWMDTTAYLTANPDVAAAGVDPMAHFLNFGAREGRRITAADGGLWLS